MKKIGIILGTIVILGLIIGILLFRNSQATVLGIVSPLASDALLAETQQRIIFDKKTTSEYPPNKHFPKSLTPKFTDEIGINATAFAVMDRDTKELLLAKNVTTEVPIASIAKIMTALVALESADMDVELTVSQQAADIGEAEMGLTAGERVNVEELLYGLMLPSGNDAAETLAEGLMNSKTSFIAGMNHKAQELGLYDSFFFNPSGLDGNRRETSNFSTPLDLLALTDYALENPTFAEIVATYYKEFPYEEGKHKAFYLSNILQLDHSYPGIKGVKPGITDFAGETLVSYAENGEKRLIVVLLGTQNSREEVIKLYDFVFSKLGVRIPGRV